MSIDDLAKLLLAISLSFSIFGISLQIIRLLGTLNEGLRGLEPIIDLVKKLAEKIVEDYTLISNNIVELSSSLKKVSEPINIITSVVKGIFSK